MSPRNPAYAIGLSAVVALVYSGCKREDPQPQSAEPAAAVEQKPPASQAKPAAAPQSSSTLELGGITLTVPDGFEPRAPKPGPMAAKAVFSLQGVEGEAAECTVRITHYPSMKGMDDANIDRWVKQVKHADGTPCTREDASITTHKVGDVRLTIVDVSGSVNTSMGGADSEAKADYRLIAAIVDHTQGPHFIKVTGGAQTMAKWKDSILAFINSVKPS